MDHESISDAAVTEISQGLATPSDSDVALKASASARKLLTAPDRSPAIIKHPMAELDVVTKAWSDLLSDARAAVLLIVDAAKSCASSESLREAG